MLLKRRGSLFSILNKPDHRLVAMLVKPIKIMILNLPEVIDVLLVSRLLRDGPRLPFVVGITARHQGVLEVSNESNTGFKFYDQRLLKGDVPSSSYSPWGFSIE